MDISNIYLKNESFEIVSQEWVKFGWLKMNKEKYWRTSVGTYLWSFMMVVQIIRNWDNRFPLTPGFG